MVALEEGIQQNVGLRPGGCQGHSRCHSPPSFQILTCVLSRDFTHGGKARAPVSTDPLVKSRSLVTVVQGAYLNEATLLTRGKLLLSLGYYYNSELII